MGSTVLKNEYLAGGMLEILAVFFSDTSSLDHIGFVSLSQTISQREEKLNSNQLYSF